MTSRAIFILLGLFVFVQFSGFSSAANADISEDLKFCAALREGNERLACYDAAARIGKQPKLSSEIVSAPKSLRNPELRRPVSYNWTGFYFGGHFGATADLSETTGSFGGIPSDTVGNGVGALGGGPGFQYLSDYWTQGSDYAGTLPQSPSKLRGSNVVGAVGLELGHNVQRGNLVAGLATDFTWFQRPKDYYWTSSGSGTFVNEITGGSTDTSQASGVSNVGLNWLGTVRGSLGVAQDRLMIYATGGLAYGRIRMSSDALYRSEYRTYAAFPNLEASWSDAKSETLVGFAVGGGMNYALADNWLLKIEGLYYGLGNASMTTAGTGVVGCTSPRPLAQGWCDPFPAGSTPVAARTVEKNFTGVITKIGMAYKF